MEFVRPRGKALLYADAFVGIGKVGMRPLPKSKYVLSPYGFVVPKYTPSNMNWAAYLHWMTKLSRPRGKNMTSSEYLRAKEILQREFSPFVVGGFTPLDDCLPDVDWSKSPGWPYVNQGCSTKREAWAKFEPEIRERVDMLIKGEYVECNFIASLKDELLPPGKNARVFLPAPFHHQLACAVLFKKAADSLTATCHLHASAIGINLFGRGLERCLRSLEHLPFGYDADQSGCDTSFKDAEPERDFMKNGLDPKYHSGVDLLFNTGMCPRVIVGDQILQIMQNPSGWYLTAMICTLYTHRTIAGAYLDLFPFESIDDMRKHLRQVNGGDDLVYSTDKAEFTIVKLAELVAQRGMYLESDFLTPRNALQLTFFSHNLFPRLVRGRHTVYVAGGRLSKLLSGFNYLKLNEGKIDWRRNASRVIGLMTNLWPYRTEFEILYEYLYHMIHHFFLLDGRNLTPEWSGLFRSIPNDDMMLALRNGHNFEGVNFFPDDSLGSFCNVKRVLQSALKSDCNNQLHSGANINMTGAGNKTKKNIGKPTANLARKNELAKARKRINKLEEEKAAAAIAAEASAAAAAAAAAVPAVVHKKSFSEKAADFARKWIKPGLETLLTIGTSLLGESHIVQYRAQVNTERLRRGEALLADNVIPQGTVLGRIGIYPNFAEDVNDGSPTTRLSKLASTYLRYKFHDTWVRFTPAAGALNNGQIGFFVSSDPRYLLTATGVDAVRLVREFKGEVCQVSQPGKVRVPPKSDFLYVEDNHASDTRFTQQGMLWIVAMTDIVLGADPSGNVSSSVGEFSLDYNIELKDDALDGVTLSNNERVLRDVYQTNTNFYATDITGVLGGVMRLYSDRLDGGACPAELVKSDGLTSKTDFTDGINGVAWMNKGGNFTINVGGFYKVTLCWNSSMQATTTNATTDGNWVQPVRIIMHVGANDVWSQYCNWKILKNLSDFSKTYDMSGCVTYTYVFNQNDQVNFKVQGSQTNLGALQSFSSSYGYVEFELLQASTGNAGIDAMQGLNHFSPAQIEELKPRPVVETRSRADSDDWTPVDKEPKRDRSEKRAVKQTH